MHKALLPKGSSKLQSSVGTEPNKKNLRESETKSLIPSSSKEVDAEVLSVWTERGNFVGKSSSTPYVGSPLCKALECSHGCCQQENESLTKIRAVGYPG